MKRWQMNRMGILNFWLYDEEVFELEQGRLWFLMEISGRSDWIRLAQGTGVWNTIFWETARPAIWIGTSCTIPRGGPSGRHQAAATVWTPSLEGKVNSCLITMETRLLL